jgi:hypothetical protein
VYCEVLTPPFVDPTEGELKKNMHAIWDLMPELTITSPYFHSRVNDSNTFTMGNTMPESTLTLCQSRLYPLVRDFGFGLWFQETRSECKSGTEGSDINENMETDELSCNN